MDKTKAVKMAVQMVSWMVVMMVTLKGVKLVDKLACLSEI
jgi:hypothetical protein